MIYLYPFTTFLKSARKKTGLTQKEFANKADLSIATIQGYEQGKFLPKTKALLSIIKVLKEYSDPEIEIAVDYFKRYLSTHLSASPELIKELAIPRELDINNLLASLEHDSEINNARFVGNIDPNNPPQFTSASSSMKNQNKLEIAKRKFEMAQEKLSSGQEITSKENKLIMTYLETLVVSLGVTIAEYYSLLNETGKKKADEEIDRLLEQLELLTKIPEYTKKDNE